MKMSSLRQCSLSCRLINMKKMPQQLRWKAEITADTAAISWIHVFAVMMKQARRPISFVFESRHSAPFCIPALIRREKKTLKRELNRLKGSAGGCFALTFNDIWWQVSSRSWPALILYTVLCSVALILFLYSHRRYDCWCCGCGQG